MSAIDPIDGLLALGVITREQLEQAKGVDPDIATTIVGRLVAVGANAPDVLQGISSLAGIPLASPAMLDAGDVVDDVPPALALALRDVPAAVIGKEADGTLNVVVAEPSATTQLASLKLPRHRVFLALEFHVRDAADRMVPESVDADLVEDAPPPPAPPPQRAPAPSASPPSSRAAAPPSEPPAIVLMPFQPSPPSAPAPPSPTTTTTTTNDAHVGEVAAAGARPVREKYAPGVKPTGSPATSPGTRVPDSLRPTSSPGTKVPSSLQGVADPFAFMNAPNANAGFDPNARAAPKPGAPVPSTSKPADKLRTSPPSTATAPKKSKTGLVAAVVVVAGLVGAGVVFGPGVLASMNPPPPDPVAQLQAAQQKELEAAQAEAAKGNPVEAIIHCEGVIKLDPTTSLSHKAVVLAAEQHVKNNDPDPLEDLQKLAGSLPASNPDKADVDAAYARLKPKPIAFDVDGGPPKADAKSDAPKTAPKSDASKTDAKGSDAKSAPKQDSPKKPVDADLDHDAATK